VVPANFVGHVFSGCLHLISDFRIVACREHSICSAQAAVYVFDAPTKAWKNIDGGLSKVDIYENPGTGTFRVVGMSLKVAGNVRYYHSTTLRSNYAFSRIYCVKVHRNRRPPFLTHVAPLPSRRRPSTLPFSRSLHMVSPAQHSIRLRTRDKHTVSTSPRRPMPTSSLTP
jgi:hypothetical protein